MNIDYQGGNAFIEGVAIKEIIKIHATPMYLYSQKIIEENYKLLKNNLLAEIFFAVKANPNQGILKLINNCGAGADVVSAGELERALNVGFDPNKIIFEGVGKSKNDIEYAIENKIRLINVESVDEIKLINDIAQGLGKIINIGVRLNPDIDGQTLDKISTGKKTDKFGIGIENLSSIILLAKTLKCISLIGISCHIGSQIYDISIFEKTFLKMKKAASQIISNGLDIKHVDLGGGFGVNYDKPENDFDIISLGKLVSKHFKNEPYKISFEPGRYFLAKAGIIITKILTTKLNGGKKFLITDAGMHTLIRPAMYGASHRIEALKTILGEKITYTVAGPICESSDIIAKDVALSEQKSNDFLIIHDVGAYGATMASNYNSRGIPAEILVHNNKFSTIHKEEIISDIINRDTIPSWL